MNGDPEIICPKCNVKAKYDRRVNNDKGWLEYLIYKCPKCGKEFKY